MSLSSVLSVALTVLPFVFNAKFLVGAVTGAVVMVVSPKAFAWVKSKLTKVETAVPAVEASAVKSVESAVANTVSKVV